MTGLRVYPLFAIACALVVWSSAQRLQDLSTFVTTLDLGRITPPVTNRKVLNAFIRVNPNLPAPLRDTREGSRLLCVKIVYPDNRAYIEVTTNGIYSGDATVSFNGGPAAAAPTERAPSPSHYGRGKFNLSIRTDLVTSLGLQRGGVRVTDDARGHAAIIDAFMNKNLHIPTGLRNALRVRSVTRGTAKLFVPQPNFDYEGDVNVSL